MKMIKWFRLPVNCELSINGDTSISDSVVITGYDVLSSHHVEKVEIAINSYDANQKLIAKQEEQIRVLLEEKRVRHDVLKDHIFISHDEFKELATFAMCNDSACQEADINVIHSVLDQIAINCLGHDDWIGAYHACI